jgi:hypothetical protein
MYKDIFNIDELKFTKILLGKNSKNPLYSWTKKENWILDNINLNNYNYGILCGKVNNLIVIDLDLEKYKKDNRFVPSGFEKMKEYIEEFGEFDTLTIKTPSGGIHYYFQYETKNKATNILINQIPNATEFYGYGIDVRTEKKTGGVGGYVVGFGSKINGNEYTIINNKPIVEMPENLAFWLLQGSPGSPSFDGNLAMLGNYNNETNDKDDKIKKNILDKKSKKNITKKVIFNPKYKYDATIDYVEKILNELPIEWTENRYNWLKVLTCLKNLNIDGVEELFYKFSAKSNVEKHQTKNAKLKNKEEWDKNNCLIDFNYIICVVNKLKKTSYHLIQKYKPIFNNVKFENNFVFENKYVEYNYKLFEEYDNIVIQSTPGTGKTTDTAKKFLEYCKSNNKDKQIISIVSLTNTANQHIKTFGDDDINIKLNDYRNCNYSDKNGNLVICINSLLKLDYLNVKQMKDKIIYIDEFECFSNNITHNKNLDSNIRLINNLLMKLVKNCYKLIISDALINENVKNFLNISKSSRKTIFIKNTYKKFKDVKAIRYHNENEFLNQVKKDIEYNNYFLFGSDSCSKITQYFDEVSKKEQDKIDEKDDEVITEIFNKIIANVDEEKRKKFLLITSKTAFKITNANEQFKDMFVFYSPSIVNSVDFSSLTPQNAYLYFNSLTINSQSMFQQATRTRNIKELKFFGNQRQNNYVYENLTDVENINRDLINSCDKIKKVCLNTNEDDEETIIENAFFKMWCFNEYTNDCYNTNKISHFQNILIEEGFKLTHVGKDVILDKKKQTQMIKNTQENSICNYENFVELYKNSKKIDGYEKYIERINILNLKPDELDIDNLGYLIYDEYNLNSYFNLLKLFKTYEYINDKMDDLNIKSYSVKIVNNVYNKIGLLRKFEKLFNIQPFDFNFKLDENDISKLTDSEFIKYKKIFRSEKKKPAKLNDLKIFYKQMIENITGNNLNIIIKDKNKKVNGVKTYQYFINENLIKQFYFISVRNGEEHYYNYDYDLLKIFNIDKPNDYKKYCFGHQKAS